MSQAGVIDVVENNPDIPTRFDCDVGFAIPAANVLNIFGGIDVDTIGSGSTVTVNFSGSPTWNVIGASQTLAINNGYICRSGGALLLLLPPVSAVGDFIEITLDGSSSFSVTQGAGQQVRIGQDVTTLGVGGSVSSTAQGDSLRLVCSTINLKWNVLSSMGNPTIV